MNVSTTCSTSHISPLFTKRYEADKEDGAFCPCCAQAVRISDSETMKALQDMIATRKKVVQVQLAFVVKVLEPLYQAITSVQANGGGTLDVLGIFSRCVL